MKGKVRLRLAPSPTGEPHVGNIRTAIFNWLFARHWDGSLIIRVEDTDQARKVGGATDRMLDALRWLDIDWDEGPDIGGDYGPYYQSQRLELYHRTIDDLLNAGHAYRCYCSPERLAELRKEREKRKQNTGYDRRCRHLNEGERLEYESTGATSVVRLKMPLEGSTTVNDLIRGQVTIENRLVDDYVMLKSDGFPTYHLANVVDDHYMEISHVMRGEEWLPSTPRHIQLYNALDWEPPQFAHLPIILSPDKSKLSKRHGVTSILQYRQMGYLPQAMLNFLTLLGWSLDDKTEILSSVELIEHFSLERVAKAGAIFDTEKLNWMNGYYIRQLSKDELADALLDYWASYPPEEIPALPDKSFLIQIGSLVQERLKLLSDASPLIPFFFTENVKYERSELIQKGMDAQRTRRALEASKAGLSELSSFDGESIEGFLRPLAQELNIKVGQLLGTLRVATTGLKVSPPLFQTMEIVGTERTLRDLQVAIDRLEG